MVTEEKAMEGLLSKRILLVTGKGGVGKTTMVAALAQHAAKQGKRVLALDVERALETPSTLLSYLGGGSLFTKDEPVQVQPNLFCARLSSTAGHQTFLEEHLPFRWLAKAALRSKQLNRFLSMAPGFQELGILYRGMPYLRQKRSDGSFWYDHVIVDLPATGHALALTSISGPMLEVFENGPVAKSIREAQGFFNDPEQTGSVIVSLPEPLVVSETLELLAGLERDRVFPSGVIVNRMPESPWSTEQRQALLSLFEQAQPGLLGEWSVQRIDRAVNALDLLRSEIDARPTNIALACIGEASSSTPNSRAQEVVEQLSTHSAEAA